MGINAEVNNIKNKEPAIEYPCIMISTITGNIVLFIRESWGTVIVSHQGLGIGEWDEYYEMKNFILFNGTITLSNSKE